MGQYPKEFGSHGQGHRLFVTEQMLELWEEMRGDKDRWPALYISDTGLLNGDDENEAALDLFKRLLALNKHILTSAELGMLVNNYNGTRKISRDALSVIFRMLLKSQDRKTLLLVDEHGKLFEQEPYLPRKFVSLAPLSSYALWGEIATGTHLIFTGTAHAKYEMTILDPSYRDLLVVFCRPTIEKGILQPAVHVPSLADTRDQK
ncbi:hypothetical protein BGX24_012094 [Mortierella sp. AD032]|nr:hypothetical protein BGX24_012094 [Mortierella sp. AD032]